MFWRDLLPPSWRKIIFVPWIWRQQVPPPDSVLFTKLHGIIFKKTVILIHTTTSTLTLTDFLLIQLQTRLYSHTCIFKKTVILIHTTTSTLTFTDFLLIQFYRQGYIHVPALKLSLCFLFLWGMTFNHTVLKKFSSYLKENTLYLYYKINQEKLRRKVIKINLETVQNPWHIQGKKHSI
jgi:hypothetical protein